MKIGKKFMTVASLGVALGTLLSRRHDARAGDAGAGAGESRSAGSGAGGSGGRSEERRSGRRAGAIYARLIGADRRRQSRDGHHVDTDRRHAGVLHEPGLCLGRVGLVPGEEHRQHSGQELRRVCGVIDRVSGFRLGPDVRRRQSVLRHTRACGSSAARTTVRRWVMPTRAFTRRSTGPAFRFGRSSSSSWCSPERPRRSFRAPWPSGSSSCVHRVQLSHGWVDLSDRRSLDLGRRLAGEARHVRLRRLDGGALGRRLGGVGRRRWSWDRASASTARTAKLSRFPATA